jgi:hypothetical protein
VRAIISVTLRSGPLTTVKLKETLRSGTNDHTARLALFTNAYGQSTVCLGDY